MRPDPGRDIQEALIARASLERRVAVMRQLREQGLLVVWQASDERGPMTELERTMFLIDRLYPEMPPQHREQFQQRFTALWEAGTWHGFRRPGPVGPMQTEDHADTGLADPQTEVAATAPSPATNRGSTP